MSSPGGVLEVERVPVDQPPAPQRKDLDGRRASVRGDADDVDRADRALVRRLPLGQVAHRVEPVPVAGRLLEALPLGRGLHLLLELADHRPRLAGEELDHALDDLPVVLLRDVADAGGQAALDVVVEAGDPRVAPGLRALARPVGEDAVEDVERLPHLLRRGVGTEVDDAAPVALPREHDARVVVLDRDGDVRVRLVVAEANVEGRPMPLDEVLLQVEGLHLRLRDDHLDALHAHGQVVEAHARVAAAKVRAHAGAERLRLPDVEHRVVVPAKEVDARLRREPPELLLDALLACVDRRSHVPVKPSRAPHAHLVFHAHKSQSRCYAIRARGELVRVEHKPAVSAAGLPLPGAGEKLVGDRVLALPVLVPVVSTSAAMALLRSHTARPPRGARGGIPGMRGGDATAARPTRRRAHGACSPLEPLRKYRRPGSPNSPKYS